MKINVSNIVCLITILTNGKEMILNPLVLTNMIVIPIILLQLVLISLIQKEKIKHIKKVLESLVEILLMPQKLIKDL
jgi:hypothetical protein